MTITEKANQILLAIYDKLGEGQLEQIDEMQYTFSTQISEIMGAYEFCHIMLKLRERKLITGDHNVLLDKDSYFEDVKLTNEGRKEGKRIMEEIKKTMEAKANEILLWVYKQTGGDEFEEISVSESDYPKVTKNYRQFCELFYYMKNTKKWINFKSDFSPDEPPTADFGKEIRITTQGIAECELLMEAEKEKKGISKPQVKDDTIILYSWGNEPHEQKVLEFACHLREEEGFNVTLDRWLSQEGTAIDFPKMMHLAITDYRKVIVVLSKGYKEKAEKFDRGVGKEYEMIIKDIDDYPQKYILVSFENISKKITPLAFKGRHAIDLSNDDKTAWNELRSKLRDEPIIDKPAVAETQKPIVKQEVGKFNLDN